MRWPVIAPNTPFPAVPVATLYEDTWVGHILPNHPEMAGKLTQIEATLKAPHLVCSATAPGYYTFVSNTELDRRGKPLIVVVSTVDRTAYTPVVATTYHGSVEYLNPSQTKWQKHWP